MLLGWLVQGPPMKHLILAHDLGTTGDKASLFTADGQVIASAFSGYDTAYPQPNWVEQNPEDWWQAFCLTTRQLLKESTRNPADIACLAFSGQMMGCVAVDIHAQPLRSAIIWADSRAQPEAQSLIEKVGMESVYRITGHRASASYSGAKILWVRNHQPEVFRRAHKFLHAKDFIVAHLTGRFVTDYSDASGMNLYDLQAVDWSQPILDAIQLDRHYLPELHLSTDVVGVVTRQAAEQTGLAPGTPVIIGGGDGCCAAAGAGVVRPGAAYNYIGSSSWIGIATRQPIYDPTLRTFTWAHLMPGMFSPTGTMQAAGGSYQWLRDTFSLPEKQQAEKLGLDAYEVMNQLAETSPPGANGVFFFPYLLGERSPRWNPDARGAYFGLRMAHTHADIIRATLEGITLNLRIILDAFQQQGADIQAMRVIGGGARGRVWRQIMADIYGLPIQQPALLAEATSLGAALAGGVGIGLFKDFALAEQLIPIQETTLPNPDLKPLYDRSLHFFEQAYAAFEPLFTSLRQV